MEVLKKKFTKAAEPDVLPITQKISNASASSQNTDELISKPSEKNAHRKKLNLKIPLSDPIEPIKVGEKMNVEAPMIDNKTNMTISTFESNKIMEEKQKNTLNSPSIVQPVPMLPNSNTNSSMQNKNIAVCPLSFHKEKSLTRDELPLTSPFLLPFTPVTSNNKGFTFDFLLSAAKKDSIGNEEQGKNGGAPSSVFDFNFVTYSLPVPSPGLLYSSKGFTAGPLDSCNRGIRFKSFTFEEAFIEGENKDQALGDVIEKKVHKDSSM